MTEYDRRQVGLGVSAVVVVTGVIALAIYGEQHKGPETSLPQNNLSVPAEGYEDIPVEPPSQSSLEDGWDCAPVPKGSWLTQELRTRGAPGIDPGPYKLKRRNGKVKIYSEYNQLPSLVYPGEIFCIQENSQSLNLDTTKPHGVVYEKAVRRQNDQFAQSSRNVQALIRVKQGF
jgi:hypothetical protein